MLKRISFVMILVLACTAFSTMASAIGGTDCDDADKVILYLDKDNDGYGKDYGNIAAVSAPNASESLFAMVFVLTKIGVCPGDLTNSGYTFGDNSYVQTKDDCNNGDASINPGAVEIPNDDIDQDCDGDDLRKEILCQDGEDDDGDDLADCDDTDCADDSVCLAKQTDEDNDGYTSDVDCDDNNATVYPGAVELCDGIDNDCDDAAEGSFDVTTADGITLSLVGTADTDYDGLSNAAESLLFNTDPLLTDTDANETADGDEIIALYPEWVLGEVVCDENASASDVPEVCNTPIIGCTTGTEACNDNVDNDDDGIVDCLDPNCYGVVYDEALGLSCPMLDVSADADSDAGGCRCNLGAAGTMNFSTFIMSIMVGLGMIGARFLKRS